MKVKDRVKTCKKAHCYGVFRAANIRSQLRKIVILRKSQSIRRRGSGPMKTTPRLSPSVTEKTKAGNTNRATMQVNQFSSRNKK